MSNLYTNPSPVTWTDSFSPINATIIAYDNDGKRIRNKQLYIIYAFSYDGSEPDLENGTKLYSNKDGIINLLIDERCRVSIKGFMAAAYNENIPEDEESDDYLEQDICTNIFVPLEPYITSFKANYISELKIPVDDEIPRKYVEVVVSKSDDSVSRFTIESPARSAYQISPSVVETIGENTITVSYYDSLLDKTWEYDIIVIGKLKKLEIKAYYNGPERQINNLIGKQDILVQLTTWDGNVRDTILLDADDWDFAVFPQITNINLGVLKIQHDGLICEIRIPFKWIPVNCRIEAWYEGPKVKLGKSIDPNDLIIYLFTPDGLRQRIDYRHCDIQPQSFIIEKEGINWYIVSYVVDRYIIRDRVSIIGYKEPESEEKDFKLEYYNPLTHSLDDVTENFENYCLNGNIRYFDWNKLRKRISELFMFGKYRLYAPKLTGLSMRYDTEWIIECDHKNAIRAELIKNYFNEEEIING